MMGVGKLIVLAYCIDATTSQTAFLQGRPASATANTTVGATTHDAYDSTASACGSDHRRIYIIRHAERKDGNACLNECGWDRAAHIADAFGRDANGWSSPELIYAFNYEYSSISGSCQRCRETVELLGQSLGVPVQYAENAPLPGDYECSWARHRASHSSCAQDKAAAAFLHEQIQSVKTIMVAWEHVNIPYLVSFLTGDNIDWSGSDYGSVVDVRYKLEQDGAWHHCEVSKYAQGYDPLPHHGAQSATSCPECHYDGSSRRRVGCPAQQ